jgi:hypothetical protein
MRHRHGKAIEPIAWSTGLLARFAPSRTPQRVGPHEPRAIAGRIVPDHEGSDDDGGSLIDGGGLNTVATKASRIPRDRGDPQHPRRTGRRGTMFCRTMPRKEAAALIPLFKRHRLSIGRRCRSRHRSDDLKNRPENNCP